MAEVARCDACGILTGDGYLSWKVNFGNKTLCNSCFGYLMAHGYLYPDEQSSYSIFWVRDGNEIRVVRLKEQQKEKLFQLFRKSAQAAHDFLLNVEKEKK